MNAVNGWNKCSKRGHWLPCWPERSCWRCCFEFFRHGREMLVDVTCWSPLYLPRIQHSAASSKYTVSKTHSFQLKSRNTNQEGRIKTTKRIAAFLPFACTTFGGSSLEATVLLHSIALEMFLKQNNSKGVVFHRYLPEYLLLLAKKQLLSDS